VTENTRARFEFDNDVLLGAAKLLCPPMLILVNAYKPNAEVSMESA